MFKHSAFSLVQVDMSNPSTPPIYPIKYSLLHIRSHPALGIVYGCTVHIIHKHQRLCVARQLLLSYPYTGKCTPTSKSTHLG